MFLHLFLFFFTPFISLESMMSKCIIPWLLILIFKQLLQVLWDEECTYLHMTFFLSLYCSQSKIETWMIWRVDNVSLTGTCCHHNSSVYDSKDYGMGTWLLIPNALERRKHGFDTKCIRERERVRKEEIKVCIWVTNGFIVLSLEWVLNIFNQKNKNKN